MAIGGDTPKFLRVIEEGDAAIKLEVANPHLVRIGEIEIFVEDGHGAPHVVAKMGNLKLRSQADTFAEEKAAD